MKENLNVKKNIRWSMNLLLIMTSIYNALHNNRLQYTFAHGGIEKAMRPLLEMKEFTAGPCA